MKSEWIRVQNKMPPDSTAVLVYCPERDNTYTANWRVPFWYHFADGGEQMRQLVTHWMPIPARPAKFEPEPEPDDIGKSNQRESDYWQRVGGHDELSALGEE